MFAKYDSSIRRIQALLSIKLEIDSHSLKDVILTNSDYFKSFNTFSSASDFFET